MKKLSILAALLLAIPATVHAQTIQNGDFSDGVTHWHGDGRAAADFANENPMGGADPLYSKGLVIPLKHTAWAKVEQEFKTKAASGTLTITYQVSPDLVLSTKPDDYDNVPGKLGWMWKTFKTEPGAWLVSTYTATGDMKTDRISYHMIKPGPAGQPQTLTIPIKAFVPDVATTLSFDVPPGEGKIVILNVSLQTQ